MMAVDEEYSRSTDRWKLVERMWPMADQERIVKEREDFRAMSGLRGHLSVFFGLPLAR